MSCTTVIATYNREDCLPQAVRSALNAIPSGEVIVVDDASTDNTLAVLRNEFSEELASERLRLICSKINFGVTGSKNDGYKAASHDWVIFLDSDDWYLDGVGVALLDVLNANSERPIVFFRCIDQSGYFVGKLFEQSRSLDLRTYLQYSSFGEALTAVNKKIVGSQLPYVSELRGYEGIGCCRLIDQFGPSILSNVVARVYDQRGDDRLSVFPGMLRRLPLLAQGHMLMFKEFGTKMRIRKAVGYLLKALVYYACGKTYQALVMLRK